jgi:hypothetical protein
VLLLWDHHGGRTCNHRFWQMYRLNQGFPFQPLELCEAMAVVWSLGGDGSPTSRLLRKTEGNGESLRAGYAQNRRKWKMLASRHNTQVCAGLLKFEQHANANIITRRYRRNLPTLPPICFKSSRNVSCPNKLKPSPSSMCSTLLVPAARRASATSLCCHAGNRMSLATPITRTEWLCRGVRPATKSGGG